MAHLKLKASKRTNVGHKAKQLAKVGILPAVVYSKKFESTPIQVDYKEFYHLYKESGKTTVIDLKIDDDKVVPCIVHDLDIHPVKDTPRHVDFLVVNLKEKITAPIPVEFVGEAPAIKEFGAVVNIVHDELEVSALPDKLPESIIVNLESLAQLSDVITIQDLLTQAVDFEFIDELDTPVVSLTQPKEEVEEELGSPTGGLEEVDTAEKEKKESN
jgi:large subunit ribosomal protein L25